MTAALQGSVEGVGLMALLRFLAGMEKSGRLRVFDGEWSGQLGLDRGRVVSAAFGHEQGLPAAEAMALVFRRGRFTFEEGQAPGERNLELPPEELTARLQAAAGYEIGPVEGTSILGAVPEVVDSLPGAGGVAEIVIDRTDLRTLLAVDGQASVAALSRDEGLMQTIRHLAVLAELGLIRFRAIPERSAPVAVETNGYRRPERSDPAGVAPSETQAEPTIVPHAVAAAPSDVDEPRSESQIASPGGQSPSEAAGAPPPRIRPAAAAGRRRFWRIPWLVAGTSILMLGLVLGNTLVTAVPLPDWDTSNSRAQPTAASTAAPSETPPTATASPTVTAGPTAPRTFQISLNGRLANTRSQ